MFSSNASLFFQVNQHYQFFFVKLITIANVLIFVLPALALALIDIQLCLSQHFFSKFSDYILLLLNYYVVNDLLIDTSMYHWYAIFENLREINDLSFE